MSEGPVHVEFVYLLQSLQKQKHKQIQKDAKLGANFDHQSAFENNHTTCDYEAEFLESSDTKDSSTTILAIQQQQHQQQQQRKTQLNKTKKQASTKLDIALRHQLERLA
jgi:hypothetical protein